MESDPIDIVLFLNEIYQLIDNQVMKYDIYKVSIIIKLDINECRQKTDACEQTCTNTPGSYECECNHGYKLRRDGRSCIGMYHKLNNSM